MIFLRLMPLAVLAVIIGCSDSQKQDKTGKVASQTSEKQINNVVNKPRVLETFDVGKDIFVRSMAVDKAGGALWVGTSLGVHEIDLRTQEVRNTFTRKAGLANEYVFAIMVDSQGNKWFGTNGGGASRYRDGEWQTYFPMHGLADYWVYSFAEQSSGVPWIGTWYGASRFDPVANTFSTYVDELVNEWVYGIAVDSKDRVWFGTEGGVSMYDGATWHAWTHQDGLGAPNKDKLPISTNTGLGTRTRHDLSVLSEGKSTYNPNYVLSIYVASDDAVWAGTWGGGVSRFDGKQWQNFTVADGLAGDIVISIVEEDNGVFWFGTNRGLSRYDGKSWQIFRRPEGLIEDSVYTVVVTPDREVWVGTKGGVARIAYQPVN